MKYLEELPDTDIMIVPLGGGGLVSGVAAAAKLNPKIKIICRTRRCSKRYSRRKEGQVTTLKESSTIADGAAVKRIGDISFQYIKEYVDEIVTVSDHELMEAFLLLVEKHKIIAENAAILSVAGLKN